MYKFKEFQPKSGWMFLYIFYVNRTFFKEAEYCLLQAYKAKNPAAALMLYELYADGHFDILDYPTDYLDKEKAQFYFEEAVRLKNPHALHQKAAILWEDGQTGVKNRKEKI